MTLPTQLDGAKVIRLTKNNITRHLSSMIFEEENDENKEVPITALAITNYIYEDRYYLFLCDMNWEVVNDYLFESIDEALEFANRNFDVHEHDWIIINS